MNERLHNFFFLCMCVKPGHDATDVQAILKMMQQGSIRWERIIERANLAFITPALWAALTQKGLQQAVPEDVAEYLKELHRLNQARNLAILRQIIEITAALNRVGVEPLLLKGAALLFTDALEDPASRMMVDIDFLVRSEDLSKVLETLRALNYEHPAHDSSEFLFAAHEPPLCRTGELASIEVHTRLFHRFNDPEVLTASDVWHDAVGVQRDGHSARILSPAHAVIFNVVHSEVHHEHFDLGRISLRDLLDFVLMTRLYSASLNWPSIHARLEEHDLARVAESYAYMAHHLLGFPMPPGFAARAGNACHYARCMFAIGWPRAHAVVPVGIAIRVLRLFSAKRMQRRFGCSDTGLDLTKTRVAYCWYLVRNFLFGAKRPTLLARLQGKPPKTEDRVTKE